MLFPQLLGVVQRYVAEKVQPSPPAERTDAFLSPYYGWIVERLLAAIRPDTEAGEAPEVPDLDRDRPCAATSIWWSWIRSGKRKQRSCWTRIRWSAPTSRMMG